MLRVGFELRVPLGVKEGVVCVFVADAVMEGVEEAVSDEEAVLEGEFELVRELVGALVFVCELLGVVLGVCVCEPVLEGVCVPVLVCSSARQLNK